MPHPDNGCGIFWGFYFNKNYDKQMSSTIAPKSIIYIKQSYESDYVPFSSTYIAMVIKSFVVDPSKVATVLESSGPFFSAAADAI